MLVNPSRQSRRASRQTAVHSASGRSPSASQWEREVRRIPKSPSYLISVAVCGALASAAMLCVASGNATADVETIPNVILAGNVIPNPTFSQVNTNGNGPAYWNMGGSYTAGDIWDNQNYIAPGATESAAVLTSNGSYTQNYSQWYNGNQNSTIGNAYGPQPVITLPTGATTVYLSYFYESSAVPTDFGAYSYVHLNFFANGGQVGQWTDTYTGTQSTWKNILDTIDLTKYAPGATAFNITISSNPDGKAQPTTPEFWVDDISLSNSSTLVPVPEPGLLGAVALGLGALVLGLRLKRRLHCG
ncbi:MAG: hypothetical protein ACP5QA_13465 [Phycisphaerae bacterium]